MLVFPLETSLKLQLTADKKSHFRSWNKGRYDTGFEAHWVTWTELKVTWGWSRLFTAKKRDKQQLDKASWQFACFTTVNLLVSLKASREKHSQKRLISLHNPLKGRKKESSKFLVQLILLALLYSQCLQTAWCQLQSLEDPHYNSKPSRSFLLAQAQVLELHQEGLEFEFP